MILDESIFVVFRVASIATLPSSPYYNTGLSTSHKKVCKSSVAQAFVLSTFEWTNV